MQFVGPVQGLGSCDGSDCLYTGFACAKVLFTVTDHVILFDFIVLFTLEKLLAAMGRLSYVHLIFYYMYKYKSTFLKHKQCVNIKYHFFFLSFFLSPVCCWFLRFLCESDSNKPPLGITV